MTLSIQFQWFGFILLLGNMVFWHGYDKPLVTWCLVVICLVQLFSHQAYLLIVSLCLGFLLALMSHIQLNSWHFDPVMSHENHLINAYVREPVQKRQLPIRYQLSMTAFNHQKITQIDINITCYRNCPELNQGENWQLMVRLKEPRGRFNPESFDYERWLYSQDIRAIGYLIESTSNKRLSLSVPALINRGQLKSDLYRTMHSAEGFSTLSSLLLGDRSELSKEQRQLLSNAGLSHLIAISGMHVGLAFVPGYLSGWLVWLLLFRDYCRKSTIQWLCGLILAFGYVVVAGSAIPAQRAFIMLCALGTATIFSSSMNLWQRLGIATVIIIILSPRAPLTISFWLSYLVTLLIIIWLERRRLRPGLALLQLQLSLAWLLPAIQWLYFHQYSAFSLLQNLWAIPLLSFVIMPLAILLLLWLSIFSKTEVFWLVDVLISVLDHAISVFWQLLNALQSLNDVLIISQGPALGIAVIIFTATFMLWLPLSLKLRISWLLLLCLILIPAEQDTDFTMRIFDTGQGTAIVLKDHHKTLLYDTAFAYQEQIILAGMWPGWARKNQVQHLDYVIVSHNDIDHSGGLDWLVDNVPIQSVISYQDNSQGYTECRAGQTFALHKAQIQVLWPQRDTSLDDNNSSCVILVHIGHQRILITGDIEQYVEQQLIQLYPKLRADILIVPHHGSRTSSSTNFINHITPQYALNSSGYQNRFGLPHPEVVERYESLGIVFLNTAESGAIDVTITADNIIKLRQTRQQNPALWRRN